MQTLPPDSFDYDLFDEEDAEGEPDESYSSGNSGSESDEGDSEPEEDVDSSIKGMEETELGEAEAEAEEVDQDFSRLVSDIRSGDAASTTLSKIWDFDMQDRDAEFKDDLRDASGVGKKRGAKPGRRKGVILSQQVRALIGEGNQAYVDNNINETIRIMQEVIRIEPRAGSAWFVLAQCHEDTGEVLKALQLRIMAAHLNQDAEEWCRLAEQSRQLGYQQQALYCYRKLYSADPSNITALWDRASLAREMGDLRTARQSLLAILKHIPHDLTVLTELRPVLIELSDLTLCMSLFQEAFDHYQAKFPSGEIAPRSQTEPGPDAPLVFGLMELLVLADLYNIHEKYDQAIQTIRQGCRWMQGRIAQRFWDTMEDDREWDMPVGPAGEGARAIAEGEVHPGMYPLDVNARHRLAISRIKMGDISEGNMHASIVLGQDILEYAALFAEIADAYFDREMYAEASNIYQMLGADAGTSGSYVLLQTAACHRMLGNLKEAADVYEIAIEADPTDNDAKMKLAEVYEVMDETRKALVLVEQVIASRGRPQAGSQNQNGDDHPGPSTAGASLFDEKQRTGKGGKNGAQKGGKLTLAQLKELEAEKERETVVLHTRVKQLWPLMLAGDPAAENEWMVVADSLIDPFERTRALFLTTKNGYRGVVRHGRKRKQRTVEDEDNMASRLQLEMGRESLARKSKSDGVAQDLDSFRKVTFDEWLRLFIQYAFNLTKSGRYKHAQDMLRHIMYSNAFQKRRYLDIIRCGLITCSIADGQPDRVVDDVRKLVNTHQYNNEPFRILLASLNSGLHNLDAFLTSNLAKHLLREIRGIDGAIKNPELLKWNPVNKRYTVGGKAEEDEEDAPAEPSPTVPYVGDGRPRLPTKGNPVIVALYGQISLASKSFQSALFYLLHAYDYCPHDPIICLSLAIASVGRAMQRQADNRHHLVTQGLAFLSRYRELRGRDVSNMDEIEFNFARVFQQLGLFTLAVKHYNRVLELIEQRLQVNPLDIGVAREAAYNLSSIYVMTGATPLAQALYRKWLSL